MDLIIDIDAIEDAKKTYENTVRKLKDGLNRLNTNLEYLRNESFEGEAKKAFFDILYADWEVGFKKHISDIEFLKEQLSYIANEARIEEEKSKKLINIL